MLSLIVYGRNDSHGYNLHKRAAISLNCFAEVLTEDSDEILFVDYNTPDDLPTFPEAIQDTLTEKAKQITRVLRVRPAQHRRFAARSHLVALEPISRNVALRASRPENRWILSTNTDMIFSVRREDRSLSRALGDLEDGFYHLPRFELPEALWEIFDRANPREIIRNTAAWGGRLHLNEIVRAGLDIVFDAPGDFQLALRTDLFAISGFDERMLLGWHVDSNLSRRMRLLRGTIGSAFDRVEGFHCDHTRQATVLHRRDRVENDLHEFVESVMAPEVDQPGWGLEAEPIEEISLLQPAGLRYVRALEATLPDPGPGHVYEAMPDTNLASLRYAPEHVLPFLLDQLTCMRTGADVRYVGARSDTFLLLDEALRGMRPDASLSIPEDLDWLVGTSDPVRSLPTERWLEDGDVYIFELGDAEGVGVATSVIWLDRNRLVMSLFARLVDGPTRPADTRVVMVNAINNQFHFTLNNSVDCPPTPFNTRVRAGILAAKRDTPLALGTLGASLSKSMNRPRPATAVEIQDLLRIAREAMDDRESRGVAWARVREQAEPVGLLLAQPGIDDLLDRSRAEVDAFRNRLLFCRPAHELAARLAEPVRMGRRTGTGSRLAQVDDWNEAEFRRWALGVVGNPATDHLMQRTLEVWERAAILQEVHSTLGLMRDAALPKPRVLVVAPHYERISAQLSFAGAEVFHLDPLILSEERDRAGHPVDLSDGDVFYGAVNTARLSMPERSSFDALLFPGGVLSVRGEKGAKALLMAADPWLSPGGFLLFSAPVRVDGETSPGELSLAALVDDRKGFGPSAGFSPLRDWNLALAPLTLDRVSRLGFEEGAFVADQGGLRAWGLFGWIKWREGPLTPENLDCLYHAETTRGPRSTRRDTTDLMVSDQIDLLPQMRIANWARRSADNIVADLDAPEDYIVFGPYLRLLPGRYRATTVAEMTDRSSALPAFTMDVVAEAGGVASAELIAASDEAGHETTCEFAIDPVRLRQKLEFRVLNRKRARVSIARLVLTRVT